ncbi:MAG: c-type cytochrome [Roseiarcus sp.]
MPSWRARGPKIETTQVRAVFAAASFVVMASSCPFPAHAAGDADHGEQLGRRWCAACHIVTGDQTRGTDNVSTFSEIAHIPGLDAAKIALFLRDPHPKMPDMQLSTQEAADLAAYIVSLGK